MLIGAHFLLYSKNAEADRTFFRDILGLQSVEVGQGWLIFALPPAEMGIHPAEGDFSQHHAGQDLTGAALYLMCDDLDGMVASLKEKNVVCTGVQKAPWGNVTHIPLPSGGKIGLYQPTHPTALHLNS